MAGSTLAPGRRFGPFEVTAQIGAGGMGAVYLATDTRLQRDVALKVLQPAVANDPERLARFRREAQVLASLNHPNIGQIHGLEEHEGLTALVLELVPGPTLADLLNGTAGSTRSLPIDDTWAIGRQIAAALEAAHSRGVIHRDLKPANIKVRADGTVKVLDFGLAKALESPVSDSGARPDLSHSPTIASPSLMTGAGMLLGTAAYMSPEQARGRPVDKRSDIWAFGCVLFEMLTGRRAFAGDDVTETLANVLKTEPDWSTLPAGVNPVVRAFLRNCLEKDPQRRLHDVADLRLAMEGAFDLPLETRPAAIAAPPSTRHGWLLVTAPWLVAAALLVALIVRPSPATDTRSLDVLRVSVTMPRTSASALGQLVWFSPDGRRLAYTAVGNDGRNQVWVRDLDAAAAKLISSDNTGSWAFWSPDSQTLAYESAGQLRLADVATGQSRILGPARGFRGGAWSPDGTIIYTPYEGSGLVRISAAGGTATPLTTIDRSRGESSHRVPWFLPDGRQFVYRVHSARDDVAGIYLGSLDGPSKRLLAADSQAIYVPQGYLLYVSNGGLYAHRFDVVSGELKEAPRQIVSGVSFNSTTGFASFSASKDGRLAYRLGGQGFVPNELAWFDRKGEVVDTLPLPQGRYANPDLSKSGRLAVQRTDRSGFADIWVLDQPGAPPRRLTFEPVNDEAPVWSPDESQVMFFSSRAEKGTLFLKRSSGAGEERLLVESADRTYPNDWSPDGKTVIYANRTPETKWDLYTTQPDGDAEPQPFVRTPFNEQHAQFSSDGRWVAYSSDESGSSEVYIQPYPAADGPKVRVSTNGGALPRWRRDGRELFYVGADRQLMSVDVTLSAQHAQTGTPHPLFQMRWGVAQLPNSSGQTAGCAISPDGQRILTYRNSEFESQSIDLLINWPAMLAGRN